MSKITPKQKEARLRNLEAGRKKRMEMLKQKKEGKKEEEYDLSSEEEIDSASESDNEAFIISKKKPSKKPTKIQPKAPKPQQEHKEDKSAKLKSELDELRSIVTDMALLQKKQHKVTRKQTNRPAGGTTIVVLPQNQGSHTSGVNDSVMDALRRSLM